MSDARYPAFDKSGKYLYFTASTNIGPASASPTFPASATAPTRSVYAIVLRNDIPSPLAPESDEEKVTEEKPSEKKDGATGGQGDGAKGEKPADKPEEKKADAQAPAGAPKTVQRRRKSRRGSISKASINASSRCRFRRATMSA